MFPGLLLRLCALVMAQPCSFMLTGSLFLLGLGPSCFTL